MPTRSLNVQITGDARSLNRVLDSTESRTKRWGGAMAKGFAVAGAAAAGGLAVGLKKSADAAIEAEKSQAKMVTQLRASGVSYRAHAKQIDEVIQKHSQLSGLDDEDLQDAFTNIVRVTGDVDKSLRLTGLAADFARAKHMDVAKAGELVGKVAGGNTGILSRYGITLDKGATSAEALATLQQKFSGQAEAYGKTTAGALDRAGVASENLGEVVGAKLTPLLAKGATALVNLVDKTGQLAGPIRTVTGTLKDRWEDAVGAVRRFINRNRSDIDSLISAMRNVAKAVRFVFQEVVVPVVRVAMRAIGRVLENAVQVIRGVVRVVSGLLTGNWGKAWDGAKDIVSGSLKGIVNIIRGSGEVILEAAKRVGGLILKGILRGLGSLGHAILQKVEEAVDWVVGKVTGLGAKIGKGISKGVGSALDFINPLGDAGFGIPGSIPGGGQFATPASGLQIEARTGFNFLERTFGGLTLSSGRRSPEHNREVGGAPNSDHLTGLATDIVPSEGWTFAGINRLDRIAAWAKKSPLIRWIGWRGTPGHGPGDHLHLSWVDRVAGDVTATTAGRQRGGLGRFSATSYGPPWGGIQGTGITATGVNLKSSPHKYGIAVDPSVIPLGSQVKVSPNPFGYGGYFTAFDTGGAIKGNRIDFYDWRGRAAQNRWGSRSVTVWTRDEGPTAGERRAGHVGPRNMAPQRFAASQQRAGALSGAARARARSRARGRTIVGPVGPPNSFGFGGGGNFPVADPVPWWERDLPESAGDPNQPLIDALAANTAAQEAHKAAVDETNAQLKRQSDLAVQFSSTSEFQKTKYIADLVSGALGRGIIGRGFTPGSGAVAAY